MIAKIIACVRKLKIENPGDGGGVGLFCGNGFFFGCSTGLISFLLPFAIVLKMKSKNRNKPSASKIIVRRGKI